MLFENPKHNYAFILSFTALTVFLDQYLRSIPSLDMANPENPPFIVSNLSTIVYLIFGVYFGIFFLVLTYYVLGPKLNKSAKNLSKYGIRSAATLVMVFVDLLSVMATEHDFVMRVFHLGPTLAPLQEFFIFPVFPILGLYLAWGLRNQKLEYVESH